MTGYTRQSREKRASPGPVPKGRLDQGFLRCSFSLKSQQFPGVSSIEDTMDKLHVIIGFLVVKMNLQLISMKVLLNPNRCPSCDEGYFLKENCTITPTAMGGIRCAMCTNCSALDRETLTACSKTADSVCGPKSTTSLPPTMSPTEAANEAADFAPYQWIIPSVIVGSLVLIILLTFFLTLLSCRFPHLPNRKGLDLI